MASAHHPSVSDLRPHARPKSRQGRAFRRVTRQESHRFPPVCQPRLPAGSTVARPQALPDRAYRPQTNGKAERWIRTVLSECLYPEIFASSEQRRRALERFVAWYNEVRPPWASAEGLRGPLNEKLAA